MNFLRIFRAAILRRSPSYKTALIDFMIDCGSGNPKDYEFAVRVDGINIEHCRSRQIGKEGYNITVLWNGKIVRHLYPRYED